MKNFASLEKRPMNRLRGISLLYSSSLPFANTVQSWACCAEERKSARSASFYLLRRNANLGFQKRNCTLCALNFEMQLLIATIMTGFEMVVSVQNSSYNVVVKSTAWELKNLGSNLVELKVYLNISVNKVAVASFVRFKNLCENLRY